MALSVNESNKRQRVALYTAQTESTTDTHFEAPERAAYMTVVAEGAWGTGGTLQVQCSNDGTNFVAAPKADGSALSITANTASTVLTGFRFYRARVTAGTSVNVSASIVAYAL